MKHGYRGVTALVTGASKGLGRAFAWDLAHRGAEVILLARSEGDLRALAADIGALRDGPDAEIIVADLAAPDGPDTVLGELRERGLTVDLLVNNAGSGSVGPFLERPLGPQLLSVGLNISGLLALTHALGADLVARGTGGIINVASTAAFQPVPYQAGYAATKAFVLSFTEALAEELRGTGVHVMAAHPGPVATGFFDGTSARIHPVADTPAVVAARTLDDYARRRPVSYPGRVLTRTANRAMTWPARLLPRTTVARVSGAFNRTQGLHQVVDVD
ncbi:SDR family oxidoreductase [Nocardiopsis sp. MG754419]|uniref:SDR family NAD(P)-dependent oxidoreductase n=1 Tax=Nocardiopsis sp. MG754419 TaxID=2259865 RepID=UPI001BA6B9F1|nr:SDR family oxidoreductase [Nocardiopsis sp. MG754419]MBR8740781.1 SDR family NAD(P)-dependent oxidoreductase [Nocardiopsis sp. MG754419]